MSIIAFDLDDTLCKREMIKGGPEKYNTCYPIQRNVDITNDLYDRGHEIIIYTARGMSWFKGDVKKIYDELYDLTLKQLNEWGIKFHSLVMGKIHYDVLVDDKTFNPISMGWEDAFYDHVFQMEDLDEAFK